MNEQEERKPLYEFYVAGVQHHQLHTCIKEIKVGDILTLIREVDESGNPTNKYDPNAVRIEYYSIILGYVPMAKGDFSSKVSAAMMIHPLRCEVLELNPEAKTWEQLKVAIYVDEEED